MEARMRRCNGMSSVRSNAEEFTIYFLRGIDGNEAHGLANDGETSALRVLEDNIDDFNALLSSVEPFEEREATIASLDERVLNPTPPTTHSSSNAFIDQYRDSIKSVITLIEKQITQVTWCAQPFEVHPPATDDNIIGISTELRKICSSVPKMSSVNRSCIGRYHELEYVMMCHSRSSPYFVQYYKQPLVAPCNCPACRLGVWSPYVINEELAGSLPHSWQVIVPLFYLFELY